MDGATKALAGWLKRKVPELDQLTGKRVKFHIALSHSDARLVRVDEDIEGVVCTLNHLGARLRERDQQYRGEPLGELRRAIGNKLTGCDPRDPIPENIPPSYTIIERVDNARSSRTFLARHDDGSLWHLRLLRPKRTFDHEYAARERDALLREYDALTKLSKLGVAPVVERYQELASGEYLIPIQVVEGRSLREDIEEPALPDGPRATAVVGAAFRALAIVHDTSPTIVHRALSPERIYVTPAGEVLFTGFQVAHIDQKTGLSRVLVDIDPDDPSTHYWRAPETRKHLTLSTPASDVYSLATSLQAWIIGSTRSGDLKKNRLPASATDRLGEVASRFEALLGRAREPVSGDRARASEIADDWAPDSALPTVASAAAQPADTRPLFQRDIGEGGPVDDRYTMIRRLGQGATAVTYLVHDEVAGQDVVLKSFDFDRIPVELAKREFKTACQLSHDRLATVRSVEPVTSPYHLVVDFVPGHDLATRLEDFVGDAPAVGAIATSLLEGLNYLHAKGYLHRDISPRNVVVSDEDPSDLKLIDFGLATLKREAGGDDVGTLGFTAPEVATEERWDAAADVYSAGVLLFTLLTGDWPYRYEVAPMQDSPIDVPASLHGLARALASVFLTAAQPDPADRYPNAGEFLAAVQEVLEEGAASDDVRTALDGLDVLWPDDDSQLGDADGGDGTDAVGIVADEAVADEGAADGADVVAADEIAEATGERDGDRGRPSWLVGLEEVVGAVPDEAAEVPEDADAASASTDEHATIAAEDSAEERSRLRWDMLNGAMHLRDADEVASEAPAAYDGAVLGQQLASGPRVLARVRTYVRYDGNSSLGVGRLRRYTLGLDGTVRVVLASRGRERTLYTAVTPMLAELVNAAKAAGGQSDGGSFIINQFGHVLVPTGRGILLAGVVDGLLAFEDGGRRVSPQGTDGDRPGAPWTGPAVGSRYKLNASTTDIAYETWHGGYVWLSDAIGAGAAEDVAAVFGRVKPNGGRFYVNEAGVAFGPVQGPRGWEEVVLGRVDTALWYPAPDVSPLLEWVENVSAAPQTKAGGWAS